ncbi:MAG TPA: Rieske 2Fe-2S domain-containing protein [Bacillota bacterium]|nr:Rieske 2Fe-2S domain-containing protein [Bacillota bacterium]
MKSRRSRRAESKAARRVDRWTSDLLAGRNPRTPLASPDERRAAALAMHVHAGRANEVSAPRALRERLSALAEPGAPSHDSSPVSSGPYIGRRTAIKAVISAAAIAAAAAAGAVVIWPRLQGRPWMTVGSASDFPVGSVRAVMVGPTYAFLVRDAAGFRAMAGTCTHEPCPLHLASETQVLACPCHGAEFDLQGHLIAQTYYTPLPPLASMPVRLRGDSVQVLG